MESNEKLPIRILHMIGSLNIGGSQAMVMNLYRKIDRTKIQFDFIIDRPDELFYAEEIERLGGRIYVLPTFNGKNFFSVRKAWELFLNRNNDKFSSVHFHVRSYISIIIPIVKKYNIPVISHSHSISSGTGLSAVIKNILQFPIRYQANYFLACSEEAGSWLFGKKILKNENYFTIKNAVLGEKFFFDSEKRKIVRDRLNIDSTEIVIGNVGRATKVKNQLFLLDILVELKKVKNAKLLILGDGDLLSEIKEKSKLLGVFDNCIFLGNVKDVDTYYHAMDIFVFPSLWEGLGISVVEAEISGLKCFISQNIPKSVDIGANLLKIINLNQPASIWSKTILENLNYTRKTPLLEFRNSGYDINDLISWYEEFYFSILNKRQKVK